MRPQLWFTYHLYYKAPDWLGPRVSEALCIPYVAAEASYAPKRARGPWALGLAAARAAISRSDVVIALKSYDIPCLLPLLDDSRRVVSLKPFLDTRDYRLNAGHRAARRGMLARRFQLDAQVPWLLTVAMMRAGNKLKCYRLLARALQSVKDRRFCLLVVGDGPLRSEVEAAFRASTHHQVVFAGLQSPRALQDFYAAADLFVWPAIDEPFGMALLEAQAAGLPVVAGGSRGVPDIVADQVSGVLVTPGDEAAFAQAVISLCERPARLREIGAAARNLAEQEHDIRAASIALDRILLQARGAAVQ
jgi:glycosyltransferase involved in cell wall biosynthesis